MDDFRPDTLPDAVTDPDQRAATQEGQAAFRKQRLDHVASAEANRPTPAADPSRQGAFEQKPDVQQQQIELWAHRALAYFDDNFGGDADWPMFVRHYELPPVWVDSLVKPRALELQARRSEPGVEVQLEGGGGPNGPALPPAVDTGRRDERGPSGDSFQVGRGHDPTTVTRAREALDTYLENVASGVIGTPDAAVIERLERLAGL